jgi:hypothetical protein
MNVEQYKALGAVHQGRKRNPPRPTEFVPLEKDEQKAVVAWCRAKHIPIIASMNGVFLGGDNRFAMIASLKAQGMSTGAPDLFIPVPKGIYHGFFCEIKRVQGSVISPEQIAWLGLLSKSGYMAVVAYGHIEAIGYINAYLA